MKEEFEIKTIDASNVDQAGFFCYMSKRTEPGYKQKRDWLEARFAEGLKIKVIHATGGRDTAFIEYIPGEHAWRAVNTPGYMVIHCLWVVGKGKGKGYGSRLIQECLKDARAQNMQGAAMLASDRTWLAGRRIFECNGFTEVVRAPPACQLMVHHFGSGPEASLPKDWEARARAFGRGLTITRTPQCPYIENGARDLEGTPTPSAQVVTRSSISIGTSNLLKRKMSVRLAEEAAFLKNGAKLAHLRKPDRDRQNVARRRLRLAAGSRRRATGGRATVPGSDQATIHNPIQAVLDCLNIQFAGAGASQNLQQAAVERAQAVKQAHQDELLKKANVTGVGVGLQHIGGQRTDTVAVVVMVKEKLPLAQLAPGDRIPSEIDGVPVDVKEVGELRAQSL